ncbi:hypothetical protein MTR_1g043390 [Medicago truncatula]|uniref:Uncharacterized protein n=1 Tax=Medicago truncatula TaxID=3880 RepID=G7I5E3_MEDTR|nr:hypothetical protein MTR_1g043390 [Medicago truncatula]
MLSFLEFRMEVSRGANLIGMSMMPLDVCPLSLIKDRGSLGVRRLKEFNLALIGKWCWRVLDERGSF